MLLKPKNIPGKEEFENNLLIEKWMQRNSSNKVKISQEPKKKIGEISNMKNLSELSSPTKRIVKNGQDFIIKTGIPSSRSYDSTILKRTYNSSSDEVVINVSKTKVVRHSLSLPTKSSDLSLIKESPTKLTARKSDIGIANKSTPINAERIKIPVNNMTANQNVTSEPTSKVQCNIVKAPTMPINNKNIESSLSNKNSIKNILSKESHTDVHSNLLENYRYLITPKSWSVTEFTNETKDRYIVFFNAHVIKEDDTLVSVMRKSLIIDKGATINYSVHGLPVDIKDTILPKILDNTKKLLSILHIFDKMQVCEGFGGDLNIRQTDFVFKDNCRYWRHKHCKIVLIKATRCSVCTETRKLLLQRKNDI